MELVVSWVGGSMFIGRNELCPCGSGKKYKKCCIVAEGTVSFNDRKILEAGELFIKSMIAYCDERLPGPDPKE